MTMESYAEALSSSTATPGEETGLLRDRRRRHSYHAPRKLSCDYQDADTVFIRVSVFQICRPQKRQSRFRQLNNMAGRTFPR